MTNRLIVTSIVRRAQQQQASGYFRVIDIHTKKVLSKLAVPESAFRIQDLNPRGGLRGARGITYWQNYIVLANSERLLVFNHAWILIKEISHPWMGGIHDIHADKEGIWVTSTSADLLLKLNWDGELISHWSWREDQQLVRALGFLSVPQFDPTIDYRDPIAVSSNVSNLVHLNAVNVSNNELLLSFGRILSNSSLLKTLVKTKLKKKLGTFIPYLPLKQKQLALTLGAPSGHIKNCQHSIISLSKDNKTKIIFQSSDNSVPNHNVIHTDNRVIFNDTNNITLSAVFKDSKELIFQIPIPSQSGFNRGLLQTSEHHFWVGNQNPAAIYEIDIDARKVINSIKLEGEPNESVYAISQLPCHFGLPWSLC